MPFITKNGKRIPVKLRKCEVIFNFDKTGDKLVLEKGNCVNFKEGTDIVSRVNGAQHLGKIVKGGNNKSYMIRYHSKLTGLVPRSKVFGFS